MRCELRVPAAVHIYDEGVEGVCVPALRKFVKRYFGIGKVRHIIVKECLVATRGLALDMIATQDAIGAVRGPMRESACDIIFTSKLIATPSEHGRLHLRASVYSVASIISTSGIVEAPAKPRDYYLLKQCYARFGAWDGKARQIAERFSGKFIDYGDSRLTEVIKGYVAQAIFFFITGNPFCRRKKCRLYNAHRQEDLIRAQITHGEFCSMHKSMLARLAGKMHSKRPDSV